MPTELPSKLKLVVDSDLEKELAIARVLNGDRGGGLADIEEEESSEEEEEESEESFSIIS